MIASSREGRAVTAILTSLLASARSFTRGFAVCDCRADMDTNNCEMPFHDGNAAVEKQTLSSLVVETMGSPDHHGPQDQERMPLHYGEIQRFSRISQEIIGRQPYVVAAMLIVVSEPPPELALLSADTDTLPSALPSRHQES